MKYSQLRDSLQSFDILVCDQKNWFMRLIGHVGMVVRMPGDVLMVWQSTTLYQGHPGTSLTVLSDWLKQYPGKVYVRRMMMPVLRRAAAEARLLEYIEKHRGAPYPSLRTGRGLWYMIKSVFHTPIPNKPVDDERMCSDRIAHTMQYCGIVCGDCETPRIEPDDFRYPHRPLHTPIDVWLTPCVSLGEEVEVEKWTVQ
jgi:hypothetical protein